MTNFRVDGKRGNSQSILSGQTGKIRREWKPSGRTGRFPQTIVLIFAKGYFAALNNRFKIACYKYAGEYCHPGTPIAWYTHCSLMSKILADQYRSLHT
jgi:hypothetical protein